MASMRGIFNTLPKSKLMLTIMISSALFSMALSATTTKSPEIPTTSVTGIECPKYDSYYNGSQLIIETVPGICELVIQLHSPSVIRGLGKMFGKMMKKVSKRIRYPDISFRNIGEITEEGNIACAMIYRHRGPFIVMDTAEGCLMIIGTERQRRMRGGKLRGILSRAERRQNRKQGKVVKKHLQRPVVRFVSREMLP